MIMLKQLYNYAYYYHFSCKIYANMLYFFHFCLGLDFLCRLFVSEIDLLSDLPLISISTIYTENLVGEGFLVVPYFDNLFLLNL